MKTSIIIPCYNEAATIGLVLGQLSELVLPAGFQKPEFIMVDDGSDDATADVVKGFMRQNQSIQLISHPHNMGKGAALRSGLTHASGELIMFCDADLELDVKDIPLLLAALTANRLDVVNGSRYMGGRNRRPFMRYLANTIFTKITALLTQSALTDMACGYKLFKQEVLGRLQLQEKGFGIEAELMLKSLRLPGIRFAEVPVNYSPRSSQHGKKLKTRHGLGIIITIIQYGLFGDRRGLVKGQQ